MVSREALRPPADVRGEPEMRRVLRLHAARTAQELVVTDLRDGLGARFTDGVVMHTGPHPLPLGERLWAVPVSALWRDD